MLSCRSQPVKGTVGRVYMEVQSWETTAATDQVSTQPRAYPLQVQGALLALLVAPDSWGLRSS